MSELRSDSQDLDRLLITNRLAKHHVRSFTVGSKKTIKDGKESSSDCGLSIRKMCPERKMESKHILFHTHKMF
jgi:hypothetical protein